MELLSTSMSIGCTLLTVGIDTGGIDICDWRFFVSVCATFLNSFALYMRLDAHISSVSDNTGREAKFGKDRRFKLADAR